jgi:hypothetical protein
MAYIREGLLPLFLGGSKLFAEEYRDEKEKKNHFIIIHHYYTNETK